MKKNLFVLGMASVLTLAGCHGLKKVSFEDFCKEVDKIESVRMKEVKISGKVDGNKVSFTYSVGTAGNWLDNAISAATGEYNKYQLAAQGLIATESLSLYTVSEDSSLTYYVSLGFKVKSDSKTVEWDKNGYLASYKTSDASLSYRWVKA